MHTARMRGIVVLALAAAPWCAASLAAQAAGTPSELVRALAQTGILGMVDDADSISVVEGRVPAKWAALIPVPPAGRVLGTAFGATAATVYLVVRGTPEAAGTLVEATATSKGWVARRAPELPDRGPFQGQRLPRGGAGEYCRGERERLIVGPHASGGESVVQLIYMSGEAGACSEQPVARPTDLLPPLQPPPLPEGTTPSDCYGPGTSSRSSGHGTRLVSDASPAAILAGYARQLEAAGWGPEAGAAAPAFGAWSKPAPGGGTSRVVVTVTAEPTTRAPCRSVSLTVEQRP